MRLKTHRLASCRPTLRRPRLTPPVGTMTARPMVAARASRSSPDVHAIFVNGLYAPEQEGYRGLAVTRSFAVQAIGWVDSPYQRRFGTPQQAAAVDSDAPAVLHMDPERIPARAFADLVGIERIWIVSWLDRSGTWAPVVRPPRGTR